MGAPYASAYSPAEERANVWTHGIGAAAAFASGLVMVAYASLRGDTWQWVSALVFSLAMLGLYLASTAYHRAVDAKHRARLKIVDHCAIYLLIAGTYTPFTLIGLRGTLGWWLFGIIWTLALAGVVFKLFYTGRFRGLSTAIYVAMGWLVVIAIGPVAAALDAWTLGWIIAGGVFYTLGTFFYMRESIPYAHAIWHLFCIAGSVCHYIAVMAQVATPR